jgi:hypothetical protein
MTTWYAQGFVTPPTGPNSSANVYGYDDGGYFGPLFGNLGRNPFLVTWTADDCNCYGGPANPPSLGGPRDGPVHDAVLTINGVSLDLNAYNNIGYSEWLDHPPFALLQMQTFPLVSTTPPWLPILPTSEYSLNTTQLYATGQGQGAAYLWDDSHPYQTNLFLTVTHMGPTAVPGPEIGAGPSGLIALATCAALIALRRRRNETR